MMDAMLVAAAAGLGVLWWVIAATKKAAGPPATFNLPADAAVASDPLLTETELSLYNRLQIAVQDRYLIFVHLPLWSFASIEAMGKTRSRLLKHMALTRVDFALMHPGSRRVEQVVQIEEESPGIYQEERRRVIESILAAAGIKLVKVRSKKSYTIPELAALLGLAEEE
jgi:hypothetical protein